MTDITAKSVRERIEATAQEIVDECEDHEAAMDRVWETVDGFDWVIYPYDARDVVRTLDGKEEAEALDRLRYSGQTLDGIESMGDLYTKLAFRYLESAISAKVDALWIEKEEADED